MSLQRIILSWKANPKRIHSMWLLFNILDKITGKETLMTPEVKKEVEAGKKRARLWKGNWKDSCDDGNILYLHCINVNILVVLLYNSFTRCYHRGELCQGHPRFLGITSYNRMWVCNYLNIKSLILKYERKVYICSLIISLPRSFSWNSLYVKWAFLLFTKHSHWRSVFSIPVD